MVVYDIKKLKDEELKKIVELLKKYREHDKLDMIIEMVVPDIKEFQKRKVGKIKNKKKEKIQQIPESLKYCDGGKCSISFTQNLGC